MSVFELPTGYINLKAIYFIENCVTNTIDYHFRVFTCDGQIITVRAELSDQEYEIVMNASSNNEYIIAEKQILSEKLEFLHKNLVDAWEASLRC